MIQQPNYPLNLVLSHQDELVQGGYLKAPSDAALAAKGAAKAKKGATKAAKRAGGASAWGATGQAGFRVYKSPNGFQVGMKSAGQIR